MEKEYAYWLANVNGIGRAKIFKLLECFKEYKNIFLSSERELNLCGVLRPKEIRCLLEHKKNWNPKRKYEQLLRENIGFTFYGDTLYPEKLMRIPDAPCCLYFIGNLPSSQEKALAVIGARCCSEYGRYTADLFAAQAAAAGVQIISGMARGIDGIGQTGALNAGGKSYAVLGCGVDICYPDENRGLYERLKAEGGIVSEYPPGTQPKSTLFPPRNRIISGLADAVLVIEAREKSGTLITVDMALEQGKEVYALPGRITDRLSSGCNRLIQQGAVAAWSPEEVLKELFSEIPGFAGQNNKNMEETELPILLTEEENAVFRLLELTPKPLETLYCEIENRYGKWEISKLYHVLLTLQMKGVARQRGQNHYVRQI